MRVLKVTTSVIDLLAEPAPFQPNYTVVVANLTGSTVTLQESDNADGSSPTTLSAVAADTLVEVSLNKRYILTAASQCFLVGN